MDPETDAGATLQFPHANITAARAVAGVLESSLGPLSHDTLIPSRADKGDREVGEPETRVDIVSSDGATILEELPIEHPIGPIIRRMVGTERKGTTDVIGEQISDGITTTVILLSGLLNEGERLIEMGVHPTSIEHGYALGFKHAQETMRSLSRPLESFPDTQAANELVARSAMTGNDVAGARKTWAKGAVEAARYVGMPDEETLAVRQIRSGSVADSRLVYGTVLDRDAVCHDRMPTRVTDANVLVLTGYKHGKANDGKTGGLQDPDMQRDGERIAIESLDDIDEFAAVFAERRSDVVDGLVDAGVDVVVTRLGINDAYQDLLADHGIMGIRGVNRLKLAQLAKATGATPVIDPTDVSPTDLGYAGVVEEQVIDQRKGRRKRRRMMVFDDCPDPESVTFLLHGVHGQLGEQAATEIRKAAGAVAIANGQTRAPGGVVPGGGATEVQIAQRIREVAPSVDSRGQLALESFAKATEHLVSALARNAGMDSLTTLTDLQELNTRNGTTPGLVLPEQQLDDAWNAGVFDPLGVRLSAYERAVDVALLVLRVDDAIDATFTKEPTQPGDAIYDEHTEKHQDYLEERDDTIWHQ
jgi:archaeal chaperonin